MKLTIELGPASYDLILKRGGLARVGQLCNLARKALLVCDHDTPAALADVVLAQCPKGSLLRLPAAPAARTPAAAGAVCQALLSGGFGREDLVLALGEGALHAAGFAAAVYLGGMDWVALPASFRAMAGAGLAGEATLSLPGGADALTVQRPPCLMVCDADTLHGQSPAAQAAGMAAALRLGLVGEVEAYSLLEGLEPAELDEELEHLLYLCLRFKKGLAERDAHREKDARLLGFGQPLYRALATLAAPGTLAPGAAEGLSVLPLLESRSLTRRVKLILQKYALPVAAPFPAAQLLQAMQPSRGADGLFEVVRVKTPGQGYVERVDLEEMTLMTEAVAE